jgi:hypothetical protein
VEDPVVVEVLYCRCNLKQESLDFGRQKRLGHVLLKSSKIVLKEVHNEENAITTH